MLNDKQILSVSASAQLSLLLDTASLSGEAESMDALQEVAVNRLLEYCSIPDAHARFAQCADKTSLPILRGSLLEWREGEHGPRVLHCDWSESSEQDWILQPGVLSLEQRLRGERHRLWGNAVSQEVEQLVALTLAATMMEEVPLGNSGSAPEPCLLVTTRCQLLEQQTQLQTFLTDKVLRIVAPEEAARILDLWLKSRGHHLLRHDVSCGDYAWYQAASLSDLPRSDGEDTLLKSLRQRMALVRYGVDMLGAAYYWHSVGDALVQQEYHFPHVVMLLTALLDSLAILVNHSLTAKVEDHQPSLSPLYPGKSAKHPCSRDAVEKEFPKINALWTESQPFLIFLYHALRNPMFHRTAPAHFGHYFGRPSEGQSAGTIGITFANTSMSLAELRSMCDEVPQSYEHYTNLGFSREDFHGAFGDVQQLEPYLFCREAWSRVRALVNQTLELLEYPDALTSVSSGNASPKEQAVMFRQTALDGLEFTSSEYSQSRDECSS
jgi:hypothetical protein